MVKLVRTTSGNNDFKQLVNQLDTELSVRDGADAPFYAQYNKTDDLNHVLLIYENNFAIACGALKAFDEDSMEIKRMFVIEEQRGKGVSKIILSELENWTKELNCRFCVLETGKRQHEAMHLYKNSGYNIIPNYSQYIGISNSVCFKKIL